jgi:hypothetical protein
MPVTSVVSGGQQVASVGSLLQNAATTNVNGNVLAVDGYRIIYLWVIEGNVGTATLTPQGSYDNKNWFGIYAAPTAAASRTYAATLSVTQNSATYLILQDVAPFIRAPLSSNSGSVTVGVYAIPV